MRDAAEEAVFFVFVLLTSFDAMVKRRDSILVASGTEGKGMQLKQGQYCETERAHTGPFGFYWDQVRIYESGWSDSHLWWYLLERRRARAHQIGRGDLNELDLYRIAMELYSDQAWICIPEGFREQLPHHDQEQLRCGHHTLPFADVCLYMTYVVVEGSVYCVAGEANGKGEPFPKSSCRALSREDLTSRLRRWKTER